MPLQPFNLLSRHPVPHRSCFCIGFKFNSIKISKALFFHPSTFHYLPTTVPADLPLKTPANFLFPPRLFSFSINSYNHFRELRFSLFFNDNISKLISGIVRQKPLEMITLKTISSSTV
jgi:hypothetical protein